LERLPAANGTKKNRTPIYSRLAAAPTIQTLCVRRVLFGFIVCSVLFPAIGFAIRGDHMSDGGTVLVGVGLGFVIAVIGAMFVVVMRGVTRPDKRD
jgi:hypothetical protein